MKIYHNGDRCPCCGTVIQDKSREWLLEFSAMAWALGFREDATPHQSAAPTASPQGEAYPPAADAAAPFRQGGLEREPGPSRTPEDGRRICRR